ncbi:MAG: 50S ribosomal protein L25 [Armatimonadetes bacterium]|nr:50S ribosomal protein L25 [Armatimonadota bacterium]
MDRLKLQVNYRTDMSKGRKNRIRREGYATASVFGHDSEPISVEVKLSDLFAQIKQSDTGVKSLFDLDIVGAPKKKSGIVIIKDIFKDHMSRNILDIGFQRVSMTEKIQTGVPIEIIGHATEFLATGGLIEQTLDELQVLCLPGNIPAKFQVDVTSISLGEHIRVSDIALPADVELVSDLAATVVISKPPSVQRDKVEEVEAEVEVIAE